MKLTEWFEARKKPVLKGVYQTDLFFTYDQYYQYWNGLHWSPYGPTPEEAEKYRKSISCFQNVRWRGLAEDPNGSKP